jgi:hypothetical protein
VLTDASADGQDALTVIYRGYMDSVIREKEWEKHLEQIHKWQASEPANPNFVLVEGTYWIAYARFARGARYSSNVPDQAFKAMHERLRKTETLLESMHASAPANPVWYAQMFTIALFEGWPIERRIALFNEATKAEPYFYPTYSGMATTLTPRWGGNLNDCTERFTKRT